MEPQPQLEIYFLLTSEEQSFHYFPSLPAEIRIMVWKHALKCRRIIRINFKGIEQKDEPDITIMRFNDTYATVLYDAQIFNNLLRVNSESRNVAKTFYRVGFPCMLENIDGELVQGTYHFNPEYDTLQLSIEEPLAEAFFDFLHVLKYIYDRLHIGLLSLALDEPTLRIIHDWYSQLPPQEHEVIPLDAIIQLRELCFVGTRSVRQDVGREGQVALAGFPTFNRALPIRPATSTFELLARDPRSVKEGLDNLILGEDPREMAIAWRGILQVLRTRPAQIDYQFLLAFHPPSELKISNHKAAAKFLRS